MGVAMRIHIGKQVPKGYVEETSMHLGKGIWMFRIRKNENSNNKIREIK